MDLNECEHFLKVNLDQSKIDQSLIDFNVDGLSFCWWCCCCCTNRRCAVLDVQFWTSSLQTLKLSHVLLLCSTSLGRYSVELFWRFFAFEPKHCRRYPVYNSAIDHFLLWNIQFLCHFETMVCSYLMLLVNFRCFLSSIFGGKGFKKRKRLWSNKIVISN